MVLANMSVEGIQRLRQQHRQRDIEIVGAHPDLPPGNGPGFSSKVLETSPGWKRYIIPDPDITGAERVTLDKAGLSSLFDFPHTQQIVAQHLSELLNISAPQNYQGLVNNREVIRKAWDQAMNHPHRKPQLQALEAQMRFIELVHIAQEEDVRQTRLHEVRLVEEWKARNPRWDSPIDLPPSPPFDSSTPSQSAEPLPPLEHVSIGEDAASPLASEPYNQMDRPPSAETAPPPDLVDILLGNLQYDRTIPSLLAELTRDRELPHNTPHRAAYNLAITMLQNPQEHQDNPHIAAVLERSSKPQLTLDSYDPRMTGWVQRELTIHNPQVLMELIQKHLSLPQERDKWPSYQQALKILYHLHPELENTSTR